MAKYERDVLDELVGVFRHYRLKNRLNESKAEIAITFNSERDRWDFIHQLRQDADPALWTRTAPFYDTNSEVVQGVIVTLKVADRGFY